MKHCLSCNRAYDDNGIFCPYDGQRLLFTEKSDDQLIGRLIDNKYLIDQLIAKGGAGAVYRAKHIQLNIYVALKIMHRGTNNDVTALERFRREAYAAMQIRHPNAIAVMDFGVTFDNLVYVVMEYLEGVTLRQRLRQQKFFPAHQANEIIQQIAAAVAIAHKRKIIHRDLKPENIFLHKDGEEEVVKVLDFGIAKFKQSINQEGDSNITRQGFVVGTPHYMSPEQCYGKEVDARADVYSLGIILYEMLTGQMPFVGPSHTAIAVKQATEKPRPTYEVRKGIPAVVNGVVIHALEKVANDRPSDMLAFAAELEAAVKAVTDQEFLKVFSNASEQDLEAALLLATESSRSTRTPKTESDLPTLEEELHVETAIKAQKNLTTEIQATEGVEIESAEIPTYTDLIATANNESVSTLSDTNLNRETLLNSAQETAMLLQIIIEDLKDENPLDDIFLKELKMALGNFLNSL
jgi:eukaryotic-like serine/threonine-protein kinase